MSRLRTRFFSLVYQEIPNVLPRARRAVSPHDKDCLRQARVSGLVIRCWPRTAKAGADATTILGVGLKTLEAASASYRRLACGQPQPVVTKLTCERPAPTPQGFVLALVNPDRPHTRRPVVEQLAHQVCHTVVLGHDAHSKGAGCAQMRLPMIRERLRDVGWHAALRVVLKHAVDAKKRR